MSLERARELGCDTMQIFSHSPRGWKVKERDRGECDVFRRLRGAYDISPVFIHSSYLINPASRDGHLRKKSMEMITAELHMADAMGADYVILHTGSASGEDPSAARKNVISCLAGISAEGNWKSGILLENTAGEKGDIASRVEEIGEILEAVPEGLISGVCIDTCHAFSAGYDMRTGPAASFMAKELERYIGLDRVKLLHVNDSRASLGSGIDRHEHIGRGKIGLDGLRNILNESALADVPLILETPKKEKDDDKRNLDIVRKLVGW
ncbi:MAG: deoxyribonuclease IV [Candidatus Sulfobium sp.]